MLAIAVALGVMAAVAAGTVLFLAWLLQALDAAQAETDGRDDV